MKKTLLAAALIAGFAGAAQAETSVTLYGILDGGIGYQNIKGSYQGMEVDAKKTGMINGISAGNRWGLKGTEDLGEDLQAVFQLESGFDLGSGTSLQSVNSTTNRLFGRQATLGLQSNSWGRLDFGRQTNISSKYFGDIASPFGTNYGQAQAGATFSSAAVVRYDNMIMYQTPNFSGFQFGVGYSFNANGNQLFKQPGEGEPNTRAITAGLRYANGPIGVALTYDQYKTPETAPLLPDQQGVKVKSWNIGASYDFEVVKLHLGYGQTRNGWFQGVAPFSDYGLTNFSANDGLKVNSYTVGLSAPIGASSSVFGSWGMADPTSGGEADYNAKQHIYSLGYNYQLSKRTKVYAVGSYAKHVAFQDDLKSTLVGVGLQHQF